MFGDSDLGAIFDATTFGIPITWVAEGESGVSATGILDVYQDVYEHGSGPGGFQKSEFVLRVPQSSLGGSPAPFDTIVILPSSNLPPGFAPGTYSIKSLPKCEDPSIVDMVLKGPMAL